MGHGFIESSDHSVAMACNPVLHQRAPWHLMDEHKRLVCSAAWSHCQLPCNKKQQWRNTSSTLHENHPFKWTNVSPNHWWWHVVTRPQLQPVVGSNLTETCPSLSTTEILKIDQAPGIWIESQLLIPQFWYHRFWPHPPSWLYRIHMLGY
jgi:hypothetical protein